MDVDMNKNLVLLFCSLLLAGLIQANSLPYDYSFNNECLTRPEKPLYGGGILVNPELNEGLKGWSTFGNAKLDQRESEEGNKFLVAHNRTEPYDSFSQELYLKHNKLYSFSGWIKVNEGNDVTVTAVFKTKNVFKRAGSIVAQSNCWSMLKLGITVNASGPARLYFESNDTSVEIWVDNVSLQPFTQQQWKAHQDESIEKVRKRTTRIQAMDANGKPLANASISLRQKRTGFPFGCAINKNILNNLAYRYWFTSKPFTVTTFEDEMKWYSTESTQGREDYSVPDAMLRFTKRHRLSVRGHNVVWDDPRFQPGWVNSLSGDRLSAAVWKRLNSIMSKYKGQLIAWDVVNENLHFSFFESKVGRDASWKFYDWASKADQRTRLFMNEYNTIEESGDWTSSPAKYLQKLKSIKGGGTKNMAIGLEGHFGTSLDIAYMRSAIDHLASAGLPIWLTEVDVQSSPNQAKYLEQILREAFSHPKVNGIVLWAAWRPSACYRMCLTDNNFKNLPTGDVVDKLLYEFGMKKAFSGTTDANGFFEASLFHGDYEVQISHSNSSFARSFTVAPEASSQLKTPLRFQVTV